MNERFEQDCGDCIDKECKNTGIVGRIPDLDSCQVVNDDEKPDAVTSKSNDGLCCEWRYDSHNDQMITGCKDYWPGYKSGEMKFCFNCGKKIKHVSNVAI